MGMRKVGVVGMLLMMEALLSGWFTHLHQSGTCTGGERVKGLGYDMCMIAAPGMCEE